MPSEPAASARPDIAVRFMLDADAAPGLLPRLLQPFARRDLIPDRMWSHRSGETLHVEIAMAAMPARSSILSRATCARWSACAA